MPGLRSLDSLDELSIQEVSVSVIRRERLGIVLEFIRAENCHGIDRSISFQDHDSSARIPHNVVDACSKFRKLSENEVTPGGEPRLVSKTRGEIEFELLPKGINIDSNSNIRGIRGELCGGLGHIEPLKFPSLIERLFEVRELRIVQVLPGTVRNTADELRKWLVIGAVVKIDMQYDQLSLASGELLI